MSACVEIEVGEISGVWQKIVIESKQEPNIVRVIEHEFTPRLSLAPHAPKPQVLPGVWELASDPEQGAGKIQLVATKFEVFSEDFEGIDGPETWGRFQLVVEKPSVGFFKIEGVAVVGYTDVALAEQSVKVLCELSIILEAMFIARVVRQSLYCDGAFIHPTIGE